MGFVDLVQSGVVSREYAQELMARGPPRGAGPTSSADLELLRLKDTFNLNTAAGRAAAMRQLFGNGTRGSCTAPAPDAPNLGSPVFRLPSAPPAPHSDQWIGPPSNVSATLEGDGAVCIRWDAATSRDCAVLHYAVEMRRGSDVAGKWVPCRQVAASECELWLVESLAAGDTYTFRVRASAQEPRLPPSSWIHTSEVEVPLGAEQLGSFQAQLAAGLVLQRLQGDADRMERREEEVEQRTFHIRQRETDLRASAALLAAERSKLEEERRRRGLWHTIAQGVETEEEARRLFYRRQDSVGASTSLTVESAVMVVNADRLRSYLAASPAADTSPVRAHRKGDGLLFHGCPEAAVANIQSDGLRMRFASSGMLGRGLYGAPDPRKSYSYCRGSRHGAFVFLCRFNLTTAEHAGPSTPHRNTVFDEYCVYDERHVVVLWMLKVSE